MEKRSQPSRVWVRLMRCIPCRQGAGDIGAAPNEFPGYQAVDVPENRQKFEKAWGVPLPGVVGMNNHEMVDAMLKGQMRALYVAGEDMISADSNANHVAAAFEKLELFVVQDIFFSETCRYADVVLPASPALERTERLPIRNAESSGFIKRSRSLETARPTGK